MRNGIGAMTDGELRLECLRLACAAGRSALGDPLDAARGYYDFVLAEPPTPEAEPEITDLMIKAGAAALARTSSDGTTEYPTDTAVRRAYSVMRAIERDPSIADNISFSRPWTDAELAIMRSRIRIPDRPGGGSV